MFIIYHILKEFDLDTQNIFIFAVASSLILILFFFFNQVRKNLKNGINRFDDEDRFSRGQHFPRFSFYIVIAYALGYFSNGIKDGNIYKNYIKDCYTLLEELKNDVRNN